MLARTRSATPWGVDARPVEVEVDVCIGIPLLQIVGLSQHSARESRERVGRALKASGFDVPPRRVTVNLAPADLEKRASNLDLPIAIALLAALGEVPHEALERRLFWGELGFDSTVRPVGGALAVAELAAAKSMRELVLPAANAGEAAALAAVPAIGVRSLREAVEHLRGDRPLAAAATPLMTQLPADRLDLADIRGHEPAKRALEVAAAGGHHLLMVGPPASGKTMLARRLVGILPPLDRREMLAVTRVHSVVTGEPLSGLVCERPFRCPHPAVSTAGLIGGGSLPRPGEVSLAHGGVLFLDELPEFRRDALEALRQPLEEGVVTVVRTRARFDFPAAFQLLGAMAACPCGHLGNPRHECRCAPQLVERYRSRLSRFLDRFDLHVEVPSPSLYDLKAPPGEPSAVVEARVLAARSIQQARFGDRSQAPVNAAVDAATIREHAHLEHHAQRLLDVAYERLKLSAGAVDRVLRLARTIADLDRSETIRAAHVAEAIQYRCFAGPK